MALTMALMEAIDTLTSAQRKELHDRLRQVVTVVQQTKMTQESDARLVGNRSLLDFGFRSTIGLNRPHDTVLVDEILDSLREIIAHVEGQ